MQDLNRLIDYIYTKNEENIQHVSVKQICSSDQSAVFCSRKSNAGVGKSKHQSSYRSLKALMNLDFALT